MAFNIFLISVRHNKRVKRVLIVEDDNFVRQILVESLSKVFDTHQAKDGKEGLEQVANAVPDVVVLDLMMPRMDGFDFLKIFKKKYPDKEVIVFSNLNYAADVARAMELGAYKFMTKSMSSVQELIRIIQNAPQTQTETT